MRLEGCGCVQSGWDWPLEGMHSTSKSGVIVVAQVLIFCWLGWLLAWLAGWLVGWLAQVFNSR